MAVNKELTIIRIHRRNFLKLLGASAGIAALAPLRSWPALADEPYRFLVVGDSLIWGQGLLEKDKFYSLVADWLRTQAWGRPREVDLKVKAHSGSTIKFLPDEAEKYKKAGRDETYYYKPEVNVGFPSMWKQIEVAAQEYKAAGQPGADLIMLTGGITDISVSKLLDPFGDNKKLPDLIRKYSLDQMSELLEHAFTNNPRALITVVGYFPILSPKSPGGKVFNGWLESLSVPGFVKPLLNNALMRPLLFGRLRKKAIARSRIWVEESNKALSLAVDRFNAKGSGRRAIFVRSPLTEDNTVEAPDTKLFRMRKNGDVEDPLFAERTRDCDQALPEIKRATGIKYPVRLCEIAAVGHPDPNGARAYAEAIEAALGPLLRPSRP